MGTTQRAQVTNDTDRVLLIFETPDDLAVLQMNRRFFVDRRDVNDSIFEDLHENVFDVRAFLAWVVEEHAGSDTLLNDPDPSRMGNGHIP